MEVGLHYDEGGNQTQSDAIRRHQKILVEVSLHYDEGGNQTQSDAIRRHQKILVEVGLKSLVGKVDEELLERVAREAPW